MDYWLADLQCLALLNHNRPSTPLSLGLNLLSREGNSQTGEWMANQRLLKTDGKDQREGPRLVYQYKKAFCHLFFKVVFMKRWCAFTVTSLKGISVIIIIKAMNKISRLET